MDVFSSVAVSDLPSRQCRHPRRSRSCAGRPSSRRERRTKRRLERGDIELEVYRPCHCQVTPPRSERFGRRLRSAQVCCRRPLFYSGKLRGMVRPLSTLPDSDRPLANEGERAIDRVVGKSGEGTCQTTSFTCFRGRCRRTREETEPGTVNLSSLSA